MCNPFSAIYHRTRGLLWCPEATDSHSEIMAAMMPGETDSRPSGMQPFARVELRPPDDWLDFDHYTFVIDEHRRPDWFDLTAEQECREQMIATISAMVVNDERTVLSGCVILGPEASVTLVRPRVMWAAKGATIRDAGYATIENAGHATIQRAGHATIHDAGRATIRDAGYATIENAGHATIQRAGHATIHDAGRATIHDAGYATIENAGHATIQRAWRATIHDAGRATIHDAGRATIRDAGRATIMRQKDT